MGHLGLTSSWLAGSSMGKIWALQACLISSFTPFRRSSRVTHTDDHHVSYPNVLNFVCHIVGHLVHLLVHLHVDHLVNLNVHQ